MTFTLDEINDTTITLDTVAWAAHLIMTDCPLVSISAGALCRIREISANTFRCESCLAEWVIHRT